MVTPVDDLREALDLLLELGMADDAVDHARQVAMVASMISQGFEREGFRCTLVGGSAIEIYAPGILKSGDIDLVIEDLRGRRTRERLDPVFEALGFVKEGRHWRRDDLFVEVPGLLLEDPSELLRVGSFPINVIAKETLLVDRVVGFKEWRQTSYGQQAIDMIAAFGDDLRMDRLGPNLAREGADDAFNALASLAQADAPVTEEVLQALLKRLTGR